MMRPRRGDITYTFIVVQYRALKNKISRFPPGEQSTWDVEIRYKDPPSKVPSTFGEPAFLEYNTGVRLHYTRAIPELKRPRLACKKHSNILIEASCLCLI